VADVIAFGVLLGILSVRLHRLKKDIEKAAV
jgi:hypothetical protein